MKTIRLNKLMILWYGIHKKVQKRWIKKINKQKERRRPSGEFISQRISWSYFSSTVNMKNREIKKLNHAPAINSSFCCLFHLQPLLALSLCLSSSLFIFSPHLSSSLCIYASVCLTSLSIVLRSLNFGIQSVPLGCGAVKGGKLKKGVHLVWNVS